MPRALRVAVRPLRAAALLLFAFTLGCDTSVEPPARERTLVTGEPDTYAIRRFMEVYSQRLPAEYAKLFTGDFVFEFSNAADPSLVQQYTDGWTKEDEVAAATHLFQGGVIEAGFFVPGALDIEISFVQTLPTDDNGDSRDPTFHKVLVTPVQLAIQVPGDVTYTVGEGTPQNHRIFLVRGDRAVGLEPDQPADAQHWYIWKWIDESPPLKPQAPTANESMTWGRIKGLYR